MLGMGITLTWGDFAAVMRRPAVIGLGVVLQYLIMPFLAWLIALADERTARTLAVEVRMQNSGLAVALAVKYFTPAAALPGALFSIWHNLTGSLLAVFWSRREIVDAAKPRARD